MIFKSFPTDMRESLTKHLTQDYTASYNLSIFKKFQNFIYKIHFFLF